jgi:hypothetical protein
MNNDPLSHETAEAGDGDGGEGPHARIALVKLTRDLKQAPGTSPNSRLVTVALGTPPPANAILASHGLTITGRRQAMHIATATPRLCDIERRS